MDRNGSRVFCAFTYAESLTYYDLLEAENSLKENLDKIFLAAGAEYLDFTPLGDRLMFQCAFAEYRLELFRKLAGQCAGILPKKISGRMLCLDKTLNACHLFWLGDGIWQEETVELPRQAPQDAPRHQAGRV